MKTVSNRQVTNTCEKFRILNCTLIKDVEKITELVNRNLSDLKLMLKYHWYSTYFKLEFLTAKNG